MKRLTISGHACTETLALLITIAWADGRLEEFVGETKEGWAKGARDGGDEHREIPADHAD